MTDNCDTPVLGIAAYSGTGKTTLLVKLLPILKQRGIRLAVVKHAHHSFDIDHKGKDSYEIRMAGASQVLISSKERWALMVEREPDDEEDRDLHDLMHHLDHTKLDLILVEGFKPVKMPKIEINRPSLGKPCLYENDGNVIAIATDETDKFDCDLPLLDLDDVNGIADFIISNFFDNNNFNNRISNG